MAHTTRMLFAAVSLSLVLGACGKKPDQGEMKIQSGEGLSLPTDFPGDVYLPSGYKVENVMKMGPLNSVVLGVSGQSQALSQDITSKMEAGGWKTALSMQSGERGAMLSFTRDKRTATYSLSPAQEDGKVTMSIQHTMENN